MTSFGTKETTEYPRMKYAMDQRDWVRAADENVPKFEVEASELQQNAARLFAEWQKLPLDLQKRYSFCQDGNQRSYAEARMYLWRTIYYNGMRQANLPYD